MGSRVLLADDSVTIRKVVGIILANEDCELTVVDNGDAAILKAREIVPDVMLVDALMPGMNGYDVCREIRKDPALSHIALLLMTGAFENIDEEKNRQSGADDFITKPFESQALIDVTNKLIALGRDRRAAPAAAPAPAAPVQPPPMAPAAPVAAAPVQPAAAADDIWEMDFGSGFASEQAPPAAPVDFSATMVTAADIPAPVAVTTDDDLWGAFEMETFAVPAAEPEPEATPLQQSAPVMATQDDDFFSFSDDVLVKEVPAPLEEDFVIEDVVLEAAPIKSAPVISSGFEPVDEYEFAMEDVATAPAIQLERAPLAIEEDFSVISFDEPTPDPVFAAPRPAVPVAPPVAPVVDVPPPVAAPPPLPPPVAPAPAAPATPAAAVSSDDQLRALLASASREVIEKIVWEVVPDLAEAIIREEIRKLKEGMRG